MENHPYGAAGELAKPLSAALGLPASRFELLATDPRRR